MRLVGFLKIFLIKIFSQTKINKILFSVESRIPILSKMKKCLSKSKNTFSLKNKKSNQIYFQNSNILKIKKNNYNLTYKK